MKRMIREYLKESIKVKNNILRDISSIEAMARILIRAYRNRKKVVFMGNGGSAADAQHLATELVSRFRKERKTLAALSLTTNTSILTAISNDYDFTEVFSRQIEALVNKGDVVVGLTTSGNSANIIKGIRKARQMGAVTIVLSGGRGGKIKDLPDITFIAPSKNTPNIQEAHITVGHILCHIVETVLFPDGE